LCLQAGDKNTIFFHKQSKARQWCNKVDEIKTHYGEVVTTFEEIKNLASMHYGNLYIEEGEMDQELCTQFISHIPDKISKGGNQELNNLISKEEIIAAINPFNSNKTPEPDGFTIHFYKRCCSIINLYFIRMLQYVQKSSRLGGATNSSFLALLPKEKSASSFNRFCPISLCNVSYKIRTKIISNKLNPFLSALILSNQGGFMVGRQTWDNTILVQEPIHSSFN
jgi:hypothetical protein